MAESDAKTTRARSAVSWLARHIYLVAVGTGLSSILGEYFFRGPNSYTAQAIKALFKFLGSSVPVPGYVLAVLIVLSAICVLWFTAILIVETFVPTVLWYEADIFDGIEWEWRWGSEAHPWMTGVEAATRCYDLTANCPRCGLLLDHRTIFPTGQKEEYREELVCHDPSCGFHLEEPLYPRGIQHWAYARISQAVRTRRWIDAVKARTCGWGMFRWPRRRKTARGYS